MGNAESVPSSKTRKERKKKCDDGVDDRLAKAKKAADKRKQLMKYRTTNPFIIFYLRLRSKKPKERVSVIARAAGKLWSRMTPEQRKKYIDLAQAERTRREQKARKRMMSRRRR